MGGIFAILVVGMLAIMAVLLAIFALRAPSTPNAGDVPGPIPTWGGAPVASSSPAPSSTQSTSSPEREPNPQFISMLDPLVGVRSTVGSCVPGGAAAVVERTVDGGATWTRMLVDVVDLRQVLSLDYVADGQISIVGTGADCVPTGLVSFTGGEFWEASPDQLASASFVEPSDLSKIRDGGIEIGAPCLVRELQRVGDTLTVLCSDGSVQYRGTDAAWISFESGDVLAAADSSETTLLTATLDPACAGTLIRSVDLAADRVADLACVSVLPANATLDVVSNSAFFWSGTEMYVSQNGGAAWAAVS